MPSEPGLPVCVPVERVDDRFVEILDPGSSDWDREYTSDVRDYLAKHHIPATHVVELSGALWRTTVFVAKSNDDCSYVLAGIDRVPLDVNREEPSDDWRAYAERLQVELSRGESISPDYSSHLWSDFVHPRFKKATGPFSTEDRTLEWETLSRAARFVLLGPAGAGKTSCLRRLVLDMFSTAEERRGPSALPVYVQLRQLRLGHDLLRLVNDALGASLATQSTMSLDERLRRGGLALFFDGLDEVEDQNRLGIADSIRAMSRQYPLARMGLATRAASYAWQFPEFLHLEIQPLDPRQVRQLTWQQLYRRKPWRCFYTSLLEAGELAELARNPLLLSIAVLLYRRNSIMPSSRAQTTSAFLDALTDGWDAARGVTRTQGALANPRFTLFLLYRLSYGLLRAEASSFSSRDACKWLDMAGDTKQASDLLARLSEKTSLLARIAEDTWAFQAESFVQQLASQFMVERTSSIKRELKATVNDTSWRQVWGNVAGLSPDPSEVVLEVCRRKGTSPTSRVIQLLDVVTQSLCLSEQDVKRGTQAIVTDVATIVEGWSVVEFASDAGRGAPAWRLTLNMPGESEHAEQTDSLAQIARRLHLARFSRSADVLRKGMSISSNEIVRHLAGLVQLEGRLHVTEDGGLVQLSLVEQSPEIADE